MYARLICVLCALTSMQLLGCVASCVVMIIEVTTALTEEACNYSHMHASILTALDHRLDAKWRLG